MSRRHLVLGTAATLCAIFLESSALAQVCLRDELKSGRPQWISTAEYYRETNEVLVADPKSGQLFAYHGELGSWNKATLPPEVKQFSSITRVEGGFVLSYRDDAFFLTPVRKRPTATTAASLAFRAAASLRRTEAGATTGLGTLYSNWITHGSRFLGFGAATTAPVDPTKPQADPLRGFQLGFIRGTVSTSSRQFLDVELVKATEANDLYLLGLPYFAANDNGFFFVDMTGAEARIVRVVEGQVGPSAIKPVATAIPKEFREVPKLKGADEGPGKAPDRFGDMEQRNMVVGLFGQGKLLYLLARRFTPAGTEWLLFEIDPTKPEPVSELLIPTRAKHLTVATGPAFWYFFERGEVVAWGNQIIGSVLRIPARWIRETTDSPLNVEKGIEVQCRTRKPTSAVRN